MSRVLKRSVFLNGHKTSVSLEEDFWQAARAIAREQDKTIGELLTSIDEARTESNFSSAIRVFVLDFYRTRAEGTVRRPVRTARRVFAADAAKPQ